MTAIIALITALIGGAIAWWLQERRLAQERHIAALTIANDRTGGVRDLKRERYDEYQAASDWLFDAIAMLKIQQQYAAGDTSLPKPDKSAAELETEVALAAHQLGIARGRLELFAPRRMLTKMNEVAGEIFPAIKRVGVIPAALHVPMREVENMMRKDLGIDP